MSSILLPDRHSKKNKVRRQNMAQNRHGFKVHPQLQQAQSPGYKTATRVLFILGLANELILKKGPPACSHTHKASQEA